MGILITPAKEEHYACKYIACRAAKCPISLPNRTSCAQEAA